MYHVLVISVPYHSFDLWHTAHQYGLTFINHQHLISVDNNSRIRVLQFIAKQTRNESR